MKHLTLVTIVVISGTLILGEAAAAREHDRAPAAPLSITALDTMPDVTEAMIDAGRKIFHGPGGCYACHGPGLGGTAIAPKLKDDKWKNGDGSYADIVSIVSNGVPGTAMVSHPGGIDDEQLHKVAAYVWAVSHGKAKP